MSRAKREQLKFRGLVTNPNELATAGDGAFRTFTNCVLTRPNLAQCRRGYSRLVSNTCCINKIFNYEGSQILHIGGNAGNTDGIAKLVSGAITAYSGFGYGLGAGVRLRGCTAGQNFYYSSANAYSWRLSGLSGTPVYAGGIPNFGFDPQHTTLASGSLLGAYKKATYRCLIGLTDAKTNLHIGDVSSRLDVVNPTSTAKKVTVRIMLSSRATANHFVQLFRSAIVDATASTDDDMKLVFDIQLKALDLSNGYIDITDIVPDALSGEYIYTSPNAGEGILEANRPPPAAGEVCFHESRTWWGNTVQPSEFLFNILAVGGSAGIQTGDVLQVGSYAVTALCDKEAILSRSGTTVTAIVVAHGYSTNDTVMIGPGYDAVDTAASIAANGHVNPGDYGVGPFTITKVDNDTFTYTEAGITCSNSGHSAYKTPIAAGSYLAPAQGTVSFNIEATAQNLCAALNKQNIGDPTGVIATYVSGPTDVPGQILIRSQLPDSSGFNVAVGPTSQRACFSPVLPPVSSYGGVTWSLTRSGSTVTATISSGTHNFIVGEQVTIYAGGLGSTGAVFSTGPVTILTVGASTLTYTEAGNAGTLASQTLRLYPTDNATSDVEVRLNRVYYSKFQEYEATTRQGWIDIGSAETGILAMVSQRGQIWVWKTDGIYRILGTDPDSFRVEALDTALRVRAVETIVLFSNRCWGLTDRGVVAISESGVEVMSGAIENDLRGVMSSQAATLATASFAVSYESEGLYMLYYPPDSDVTNHAAGACRRAYVYRKPPPDSDVKGTWSQWDFGAQNGKRCGLVNVADDLLYWGDQYQGLLLTSYVYKERKALTAADFKDTTGANVDTAITQTMTWLLQTEAAPSSEKRWDELAFMFVSGEANFTLALSNEVNTITPVTVASQSNQTARVWIPTEVARGTRLLVTVTHAVASEAFDLAGVSTLAEVLDGATGK